MEGGKRKVGLVYDERMCAHADPFDLYHPETPQRILSIAERLKSAGIFQRCVPVEAREATDDELASVHTKGHIKLMRDASSAAYGKQGRKALARLYNSIYFNEGSSESALLAAGSVVELAARVAQGELEAGAAIVRPPGHHAEADAAMGFCLFNNVAIAAHVLVHEKKGLGISKVLVVDWDVHHGNGTQHMFWDDPQVLYFSVHRYDDGSFYPASDDGYLDKIGIGDGAGYNVNVPWPHGGFGDADYLAVWDYLLLPIAKEYNPDIVLISAGFDSAEGDPLGGCRLTPFGFSEMTRKLMDLAKGHVVLVLEGGYNLKSIAESYLSCLQVLLGEPSLHLSSVSKPFVSTLRILSQVHKELQNFWPVLAKFTDSIQREMMDACHGDEITPPMYVNDGESPERHSCAERDVLDGENQVNYASTIMANGEKEKLNAEDVVAVEEVTANLSLMSLGQQSDTRMSEEKIDHRSPHSDLECIISEAAASICDDQNHRSGELKNGLLAHEKPVEAATVEVMTVEGATVGMTGNNVKALVGLALPMENTDLDDAFTQAEKSQSDEGIRLSESLSRATVMELAPRVVKEKPQYVWYASYGSNMWEKRFLCYIQGGQVEGMRKECLGARNKDPPIATIWMDIGHDMFFGHSYTSFWGHGGVAFLELVPKDSVLTHVRLYKITVQQLNDLFMQENNFVEYGEEYIGPEVCCKSSLEYSTIVKDRWYGTVLCLGEKDGLPMLTLTCSESDLGKFKTGLLPICPPSEAYQRAVTRGLVEDMGLSEEAALAYVTSKIAKL